MNKQQKDTARKKERYHTDTEYREAMKKQSREWQKNNLPSVYKRQNKWRAKNRERNRGYALKPMAKAYIIYDEKCGHCGNTNLYLLQWHHRKKGNNERYPNGENADKIQRRIVKEGKQDPNIELLCANCHILANIKDGTKTAVMRSELSEHIRREKHIV